ncbi:MAG: hypothetical protein JW819_13605 [Candidatus Krumholzibacteriota bacterium]|nr:hypothetical protein [Candidatus Krumholzibacteriota bacterium]
MEQVPSRGNAPRAVLVALLVVLAAGDLAWGIARGYTGPIIGGAGYSVAIFLVWRRREHGAAVTFGVFGLVFHLAGLLRGRFGALGGLDYSLALANTFLPAALVVLGLLARRTEMTKLRDR